MSISDILPSQISWLTQDQIAALTDDDIATLSIPQIRHFSAQQFWWFSPGQIAPLTPTEIYYIAPVVFAALDPAVVAEFSDTQLTALRLCQASVMSVAQAASLSPNGVASLTVPVLKHLSVPALRALTGITAAQARSLPPAVLGELSATQFASAVASNLSLFGGGRFVDVTAEQTATLTVGEANSLTAGKIKALTAQAIGGMSANTLGGLRAALVQALTGDQLNGMGAASLSSLNFAYLTSAQIASLNATTLSGLSASAFAALVGGNVASLSTQALAGVSVADLTALTPAQEASFTADQLNSMGAAALSSLDPAYLTSAQIASLNAATISGLSANAFAALVGGNVSSLSTQALAGVSVADLTALTPTQAASFTATQIAAMNAAQMVAIGIDPISADLAAHETNGALSYSGALAVLQDAATGGMTQSKFSTLTTIANNLVSGAIQSSNYVAQMFSNAVLGNSANAWWTGGTSSRVALGDLTTMSSQTQANELVGKWFLGTDLPNPSSPGLPLAYLPDTSPLYGASGAPQLTDVSQGGTGDCYFLASIAEIALQDPTAIENAIQSNGNGTYSVDFQVNGQPDFVTVNNAVPTLTGAWQDSNGQTIFYDNGYGTAWSALLEKAFVQLNEQQGVSHGMDGVAANSYSDIAGGWDWPLTYLTGQQTTPYFTGSTGVGGVGDHSTLSALQADLAHHGEVIMATGTVVPQGSNLVGSHMFAVTGVDAAAGTVTLFNPWGKNTSMVTSFTTTIATLDAAGVVFSATSGNGA